MADVCLTGGASSVLSPLSPNESRKRRHSGHDAGDGCSSWYKRHRNGSSFARRLLHTCGFSVDARQAEDLVRFIDSLPAEMENVSRPPRVNRDLKDLRAHAPPAILRVTARTRSIPRAAPHPHTASPAHVNSGALADAASPPAYDPTYNLRPDVTGPPLAALNLIFLVGRVSRGRTARRMPRAPYKAAH